MESEMQMLIGFIKIYKICSDVASIYKSDNLPPLADSQEIRNRG